MGKTAVEPGKYKVWIECVDAHGNRASTILYIVVSGKKLGQFKKMLADLKEELKASNAEIEKL